MKGKIYANIIIWSLNMSCSKILFQITWTLLSIVSLRNLIKMNNTVTELSDIVRNSGVLKISEWKCGPPKCKGEKTQDWNVHD